VALETPDNPFEHLSEKQLRTAAIKLVEIFSEYEYPSGTFWVSNYIQKLKDETLSKNELHTVFDELDIEIETTIDDWVEDDELLDAEEYLSKLQKNPDSLFEKDKNATASEEETEIIAETLENPEVNSKKKLKEIRKKIEKYNVTGTDFTTVYELNSKEFDWLWDDIIALLTEFIALWSKAQSTITEDEINELRGILNTYERKALLVKQFIVNITINQWNTWSGKWWWPKGPIWPWKDTPEVIDNPEDRINYALHTVSKKLKNLKYRIDRIIEALQAKKISDTEAKKIMEEHQERYDLKRGELNAALWVADERISDYAKDEPKKSVKFANRLEKAKAKKQRYIDMLKEALKKPWPVKEPSPEPVPPTPDPEDLTEKERLQLEKDIQESLEKTKASATTGISRLVELENKLKEENLSESKKIQLYEAMKSQIERDELVFSSDTREAQHLIISYKTEYPEEADTEEDFQKTLDDYIRSYNLVLSWVYDLLPEWIEDKEENDRLAVEKAIQQLHSDFLTRAKVLENTLTSLISQFNQPWRTESERLKLWESSSATLNSQLQDLASATSTVESALGTYITTYPDHAEWKDTIQNSIDTRRQEVMSLIEQVRTLLIGDEPTLEAFRERLALEKAITETLEQTEVSATTAIQQLEQLREQLSVEGLSDEEKVALFDWAQTQLTSQSTLQENNTQQSQRLIRSYESRYPAKADTTRWYQETLDGWRERYEQALQSVRDLLPIIDAHDNEKNQLENAIDETFNRVDIATDSIRSITDTIETELERPDMNTDIRDHIFDHYTGDIERTLTNYRTTLQELTGHLQEYIANYPDEELKISLFEERFSRIRNQYDAALQRLRELRSSDMEPGPNAIEEQKLQDLESLVEASDQFDSTGDRLHQFIDDFINQISGDEITTEEIRSLYETFEPVATQQYNEFNQQRAAFEALLNTFEENYSEEDGLVRSYRQLIEIQSNLIEADFNHLEFFLPDDLLSPEELREQERAEAEQAIQELFEAFETDHAQIQTTLAQLQSQLEEPTLSDEEKRTLRRATEPTLQSQMAALARRSWSIQNALDDYESTYPERADRKNQHQEILQTRNQEITDLIGEVRWLLPDVLWEDPTADERGEILSRGEENVTTAQEATQQYQQLVSDMEHELSTPWLSDEERQSILERHQPWIQAGYQEARAAHRRAQNVLTEHRARFPDHTAERATLEARIENIWNTLAQSQAQFQTIENGITELSPNPEVGDIDTAQQRVQERLSEALNMLTQLRTAVTESDIEIRAAETVREKRQLFSTNRNRIDILSRQFNTAAWRAEVTIERFILDHPPRANQWVWFMEGLERAQNEHNAEIERFNRSEPSHDAADPNPENPEDPDNIRRLPDNLPELHQLQEYLTRQYKPRFIAAAQADRVNSNVNLDNVRSQWIGDSKKWEMEQLLAREGELQRAISKEDSTNRANSRSYRQREVELAIINTCIAVRENHWRTTYTRAA